MTNSSKLFIVPIESYDARYTEQWNRWFPSYLSENGIPYEVVTGDEAVVSPVGSDAVLDPIGTHLYKFQQLHSLVEALGDGKITHGDTILFHTLWFPGLEALQYIRQTAGIDFKIVGVLHAGTYDPWDFRTRLGMGYWADAIEQGWLSFVDRIFVATRYHKDLILAKRSLDPSRIYVTGLPLNMAEVRQGRTGVPKEDLVAFPHREVPEKDPEIVRRLSEKLAPGATIVKTRDLTKTKAEYYDLLARCKVCVSNSWQETFGYAMVEAAALGVIPLVPDRLSYSEMFPEQFRFTDEEQLVDLMNAGVAGWSDPTSALSDLLVWADGALGRMINLCLDW